jgi:hypothetical protein
MEGGFAASLFFGGKPAWLDHRRRHDVDALAEKIAASHRRAVEAG